MKTAPRIGLAMRVPPPLMFVLTFFAGAGLERLVPLTRYVTAIAAAGRILGAGLLIAGLLLTISSAGMFLWKRTTLVPFGAAAHLVTRGQYRFTRNPMYLGLVVAYLGMAGLLTQPWPIVLLPLPVAVLNALVIPFEEERLREIFGASFVEYCTRVRRWI
jgi:protein-S-isoprenylcysteine O-methyltransferase Ste14